MIQIFEGELSRKEKIHMYGREKDKLTAHTLFIPNP